ncbi:MAG TPA: C40 family peptidase [Chitinophagaceae bacterium]|nr:C40 family peptidase [Chitinophagaceae bacterium]
MIKNLIVSSALILCTAGMAGAQKNKKQSKTAVKFLDGIEVGITPSSIEERSQLTELETQFFTQREIASPDNSLFRIENATKIQLKYAQLLDVEVERLQNHSLYTSIDSWFGTRYRLGGSTKEGIDCSALTQITYATQFGITLPRTAREQYEATQRISRTDLKEGDLVFFNTQGGISHVGIYLQNNKFYHASSSGVTISDLYDAYWEKRFMGVGRFQKAPDAMAFSKL